MYARDDYKRCVCDTWGNGEADCPQAGGSNDDQDGGDDGGNDGGQDGGDGGQDGGDDGGDNGGNDGGSDQGGNSNTVDDLLAAIAAIHNTPHYSDDQKSRTNY